MNVQVPTGTSWPASYTGSTPSYLGSHPELQKLIGSSSIGPTLGAQVSQYANCPVTLGGLIEPTSTFVRNVGTPIARTVRDTLSDTGKGFIKLTAVHIFGPLFLISAFFVVLLALVGIIGWWTALIMIFVLFALLYLFTISYSQSIAVYAQTNIDNLNNQISGILTRSNTSGVAQTFLNANQKSSIPCGIHN